MKKLLFPALITVLFVTMIIACKNGGSSKNENNKEAEISFSEKEFDFGELEFGSGAVHEFEFTNIGNKPLILKNVKPTCGCTVADWTKDPIKPGGKSKIEVRYSTRNIGKFVKSINVTSNAVTTDVVLKIKGTVVKAPSE